MSRIVIEEHTDIARPPEDVFAFVADGYLENLRTMNPAIVELRALTNGPITVGTRAFEAQMIQNKRRERTFRVTKRARPTEFEVQGEPAGIEKHYLGRYRFEKTPTGTRYHQRFELEWDEPMFKFAPWLVRYFIRKDIRRAQGVVKAAVERSTAHVR